MGVACQIASSCSEYSTQDYRQVFFAGHRLQVINKVGRRYLKLEIQCFKNTVAVASLRTSCKFDLYRYLFTLRSKRGDVVTKVVPFIFRQTKTEKYPLTSLVVLRSLKNKRHLKDCYVEENPCETRTCSFSEAKMAEVIKVCQIYSSILVHFCIRQLSNYIVMAVHT